MNFEDWLYTDEGRLVSYYPAKEMCQRSYEAGQRNAVQPAAAAIPALGLQEMMRVEFDDFDRGWNAALSFIQGMAVKA